jgi:hypothetical protein
MIGYKSRDIFQDIRVPLQPRNYAIHHHADDAGPRQANRANQ